MVASKENDMIPQENPVRLNAVRKIAPFISLYHEVIETTGQVLPQQQERAAIALAVMTHDPQNLRHLSELWGTPEEQLRVSIRDSYYDPVIKQVGYEIFDRQKANEVKEKQEKEEGEEKKTKKEQRKKVDTIIDNMWATLPATLLTDHQRQVVDYVNQGKNSKEIAILLGITPTGVSNILRRIRRKLAPYITKHGLVRIHSTKETSLYHGAQHGSFDSGKILLSTYSTKPVIERYLDEQRKIDPLLIIDGYIPLSDRTQIASNERSALSRRAHADHVIKKNGFLYVSAEYLNEYRRRKVVKRKIYDRPTQDHQLIAESIPLEHGHENFNFVYRQIIRRIQSGEIPSIKVRGKTFVLREDVAPLVIEAMDNIKTKKKYKPRTRS